MKISEDTFETYDEVIANFQMQLLDSDNLYFIFGSTKSMLIFDPFRTSSQLSFSLAVLIMKPMHIALIFHYFLANHRFVLPENFLFEY